MRMHCDWFGFPGFGHPRFHHQDFDSHGPCKRGGHRMEFPGRHGHGPHFGPFHAHHMKPHHFGPCRRDESSDEENHGPLRHFGKHWGPHKHHGPHGHHHGPHRHHHGPHRHHGPPGPHGPHGPHGHHERCCSPGRRPHHFGPFERPPCGEKDKRRDGKSKEKRPCCSKEKDGNVLMERVVINGPRCYSV